MLRLTLVRHLHAAVERLRNGGEVRPEAEFVNDVREVHDWGVRQ